MKCKPSILTCCLCALSFILFFLFGGSEGGVVHSDACVAPPRTEPTISKQSGTDALSFCGMQFVNDSKDYERVRNLGVTVVLQTFQHDGTTKEWLAQLNELQANDLRAIAVLWPQGWEWRDDTWQIDSQARLFLQTVASHQTTLAVFGLQEPYWQGCRGCGLTTTAQQELYQAIKNIADVPIYSELGDIGFWAHRGPQTTLADGVCDYCGVWFYPAFADGSYRRQEFIDYIDDNLTHIHKLAPNSKMIWLLQIFAKKDTRRMPTLQEIRDMGAIVAEKGVDGIFWYVWQFGPLYSDFLSNHPELFPAVSGVSFCAAGTPSPISLTTTETLSVTPFSLSLPAAPTAIPPQVDSETNREIWGRVVLAGFLLLGSLSALVYLRSK